MSHALCVCLWVQCVSLGADSFLDLLSLSLILLPSSSRVKIHSKRETYSFDDLVSFVSHSKHVSSFLSLSAHM